MSDLVATNCNNGCGCERSGSNSCCNNIIWILLILAFCGNNGCGSDCGSSWGFGRDNDCCSIIWILLILSFCGNGSGFFGGGCGCGC